MVEPAFTGVKFDLPLWDFDVFDFNEEPRVLEVFKAGKIVVTLRSCHSN